MKSLLIVSHGSRRQEANDEIIGLVDQIKTATTGSFTEVHHAFLECSAPGFETQIEQLVAKGCSEIVIFPLFLAAGKHVTVDLPQLIEVCLCRFPEITFELKPHLGEITGLNRMIANALIC